MQYLIWSKCHSRDLALWWAPGGSGYTTDLRKAGRFTHERATELVGIGTCARAENILIPEWEALGLVNKLVVETGKVFSRAAILERLSKGQEADENNPNPEWQEFTRAEQEPQVGDWCTFGRALWVMVEERHIGKLDQLDEVARDFGFPEIIYRRQAA